MQDPVTTSPAVERIVSLKGEPTLGDASVPDSETGVHSHPEAYDYDFNYMVSQPEGEQKEVVPPSAEPASQEGQPAKVEPPAFPVPPIATKALDEVEVKPAPKAETLDVAEKRYRDLQSLHDKSIAEKEKELEAIRHEVDSLKAFKAAKDELEKNPLAFLQQYFPQLAEKVNPRRVILDKLREEFGAETIEAYRPEEAYIEGSNSYKIREREDALREELQRTKLEAELSRSEETRRQEAFLNESKTVVMKEYGLDENTFQREIIEWSKQQPPITFKEIARLKYFDWHIQQAVNQALAGEKKGKSQTPPPSIVSVGGGSDGEKVSREYKDLQDTFGDM